MKKKRGMAFFLAACLTAVLWGGCSTEESAPEFAPKIKGETVSIVFYDSIRNFEATDRIVKAFNLQSATTLVSVRYFEDGEYNGEIDRMLANGSGAADCFYINQASRSNQLAANGSLADLGDFVRSSELNMANYGTMIDAVTLDEKIYSLPMSKNAWLLFYNKEYFDRMGQPYPGQLTWEEYAALSKSLTEKKGYRQYYGGFIPPWTMNIGAAAAGEHLTDDELPVTRRYVELLDRLYNVDESHPNLMDMLPNYGEPYDLFENGQLAMMVNGDWTISRLKDDFQQGAYEFDWDIAPLPVFEFMDGATTAGNGTYFGVSATSAHKENAFEFAAYYCGEQGAVLMAENASCPAYLMELSSQTYLANAGVPGARYFFDSYTVHTETPHPLYEEMNVCFEKQVSLYLAGLQSLDETFENYGFDRQKLLSEES